MKFSPLTSSNMPSGNMPSPLPLILASTSIYRQELLSRLQHPYTAIAPLADEAAHPGEDSAALAERLAETKARSLADRYPSALIIGSDQVAYCGAQRFGKPGSRERACQQLQSMRGKEVIFHTGLCLLNTASGRSQLAGVPTRVRMRALSDEEIHRYLDREDALNCAGSAKSEGLGIALMDALQGDDPTALVGLPLIALCRMLRAEGIALP